MIKLFKERITQSEAQSAVKFFQTLKRLKWHKYERLQNRYEREKRKALKMNSYFKSLIDFNPRKLNYEADLIKAIHFENIMKKRIDENAYIHSTAEFIRIQYMLKYYINVAKARSAELAKERKYYYLLSKSYFDFKNWTKRKYGYNSMSNPFMKYLKFR